MINFPKPIQRAASCLLVVIIAIPILLKIWKGLQTTVPLPIFLGLTEKLVFITLAAQCLFLPALLISSLKPWAKTSLGILYIPACLLFIVLFLQSSEHVANSVKVDQRNLYLVDFLNVPEAKTSYYLYECDSQGLQCEKVDRFFLTGTSDLYETEFVIDDEKTHIFINGDLQFTHAKNPINYEFLDEVVLGNYAYSIALAERIHPATFIFYRVRSDTKTGAEILPFKYSVDEFDDIELRADAAKEEVYVVIDDRPIYQYGSTPQCFVENCVTSSE